MRHLQDLTKDELLKHDRAMMLITRIMRAEIQAEDKGESSHARRLRRRRGRLSARYHGPFPAFAN